MDGWGRKERKQGWICKERKGKKRKGKERIEKERKGKIKMLYRAERGDKGHGLEKGRGRASLCQKQK